MNIIILYTGYLLRSRGTPERIIQIADGLASLGARVILSGGIWHHLKGLHPNLRVMEMPNRLLKLPSFFGWIAKLIAGGLSRKYDVVQIESFPFTRTLVLLLLLRPFSKKSIIVFHDRWFTDNPRESLKGRIQLFLQRILFSICRASIAVGQIYKDWYEELHGEVVRDKMVVIPNGVPELDIQEDVDHSALRKQYGLEQGAFIALFFGTMDFKPNLEAAQYLYKISHSISKQFEKATGKKLIFIVAGRGSKALLPKTDWYRPLGFVEKLDDLYSLPDTIVIPHLPTLGGTHVKTIYSFQSGKPVVATENAVRGMPYVYPQKHFLLFDSDNPNTLLEALIELFHNSRLKRKLVNNAQRYAQRFSWKNIASLHLKLYEKLESR